MNRQFHVLKNAIHAWCTGGGVILLVSGSIPALKQQGDIMWNYGGTPPVQDVSTVQSHLIRCMLGFSG